MERIERHRTALHRRELSRPVRLAIADQLLDVRQSFFDYGCGHGDDVRLLHEKGVRATGWDPAGPKAEQVESDVVNLGYVVNVIEDPDERMHALREAWRLTRRLLVVSARLEGESREPIGAPMGDGLVTRLRTFQKFFTQDELRSWIAGSLREEPVPAAPGVFYLFRSSIDRETFVAARFRSRIEQPRIRRSDQLYAANEPLFAALSSFMIERGRLPEEEEHECAAALREQFGSVKKAFLILCRVAGVEPWKEARRIRFWDLLVYLALARFGGRTPFSKLPLSLQWDIRALFSSYRIACSTADELLMTAGQLYAISAACRESSVGKLMPTALYVHSSALPKLPPLLRIYEGCARAYVGAVEGANVIKLSREAPRVSYLKYPSFDEIPHPAIESALSVSLDRLSVRIRRYSGTENPPILHRKEALVSNDYPLRAKFSRMTSQEEKYGLYADPSRIGFKRDWVALLASLRLSHKGHRLIRGRE